MRFENVPIELKGREIGTETDERFTVIFQTAIFPALSLPLKSQIVFQVVFDEQVLLEIQNFGEVIPAQLDQRFANFLRHTGHISPLVEQQNCFISMEEQMPRQSESGEARADNNDVVFGA